MELSANNLFFSWKKSGFLALSGNMNKKSEKNLNFKSRSNEINNSFSSDIGQKQCIKLPLFNMKPHMRTPKTLLHNYCQKSKRPKPRYNNLPSEKGKFRVAVILDDPKGKPENSLRFETKESFENNEIAQHYSAMLALKFFEGTRPLYKLFPYPLDEAWKSMDSKTPLVTRKNDFISQKERDLFEEKKTRKKSEFKNNSEISEYKQKLETPTLSMSSNIRKKTINLIMKHFPMLTESYKFNSWLFNDCNEFSGIPNSFSRAKLVSFEIDEINKMNMAEYSKFLTKYSLNTRFIIVKLNYWFDIDCQSKDKIIGLIRSCGFDNEKSATAFDIIRKEINKKKKFHKYCTLNEGIYDDYFEISNTCIIRDIVIRNYPSYYIAWICIMWLSIHINEDELPLLITPKKSQIEVKGYSDRKIEKKEDNSIEFISNRIKNIISLESKLNIAETSTNSNVPEHSSNYLINDNIKIKRYEYLSASKNAEIIVNKLKSSQILVIKGETGCGKTTQIPILIYQGILQFSSGMIYCSQPRRLAAISISERVKSEVEKENHGKKGNIVGYSVRLDNNITSNTRLIYCTHGILINIIKFELIGFSQKIENQSKSKIPLNSILIIDEAHERSLDVDLLLYFMKQLIYLRKDLKIVIMSASIEVHKFVDYFNTRCKHQNSCVKIENELTEDYRLKIETIDLPGRTPFPIEIEYISNKKEICKFHENELENKELEEIEYLKMENEICKPLDISKLKELIISILMSLGTEQGSVLIFLGGIGDVNKLVSLLKEEEQNENLPISLHVLACHSNLDHFQQLEIFKTYKNKRKVIVSTNIAEVSLTVEDIRYVIDTGRVRITIYDPIRHVTSLQEVFISRSSAQQRMGRAGRTSPGKCFRLYSEQKLLNQPLELTPEILRLPIEHIILDILCYLENSKFNAIKDDPSTFRGLFKVAQLINSLRDFFTPPKLSSIESSLLSLRNYGALDDTFEITPLGELLSKWPVDLNIGILFLYGLIFDCIDPILTIASFLTCGIPWKFEENKAPKSSINCDYMMFIKVYNYYIKSYKKISNSRFKNCLNLNSQLDDYPLPFDPKFLDISKMETIYQTKKHFLRVLYIKNFEEVIDEKLIFSKWNIIQSCIATSLYPNIACIRLPNKIKYVKMGSGLFAQPIQFNKLLLYCKNKSNDRSFNYHFDHSFNEEILTKSNAFEIVRDSKDICRVFLSESSSVYNRMYDIGTFHCIMYMGLFQSFNRKNAILRFPIPISIYSLLLFSSDSLQLNPVSLLNQMRCLDNKKSQENEIDFINHILIDNWILLQCPGQIQSIIWYFRFIVQEMIQFISMKLLESESHSCMNHLINSFSVNDTNEIIELLYFFI